VSADIWRDKFEFVRNHARSEYARVGRRLSVLDAGCRGCELRPYVEEVSTYTGVDIYQNRFNSVDVVQDVGEGLPFDDEAFDIVVALDLLEHLDDFCAGMVELSRVTRGSMVVVLPNLAHAYARFSYALRGRFHFTDKYDLQWPAPADRHRWLTVLPQMERFMIGVARDMEMDLRASFGADGRKKLMFARAARTAGVPASFWAWKVAYILSRRGVRDATA
jgi:SAM-dependent methyltransferase